MHQSVEIAPFTQAMDKVAKKSYLAYQICISKLETEKNGTF